jgi:dephospho-CoA kinase
MVGIAITGGIACGKSLVGALMGGWGVEVCDADDLAHHLMEPGAQAYGPVVAAFGREILTGDGRVDRRRLGDRVFADGGDRERLNAIVHPLVKEAWRDWVSRRPPETRAAAVLIPLLYEAGEGEGWDAVVCVVASEATQRARLAARGLDGQEARRRMAAQMPLAEKAERADFVILNDGTLDVLREQTMRVLERILEI